MGTKMIKRDAPAIPCRQTTRLPFTLAAVRELRVQRADGAEVDIVRVEGHASVVGYEYEVYGGPPYGWVERIGDEAFTEALQDDPDVVFLVNHEGIALARTKSGTLSLSADPSLRVAADLDVGNPVVQSLASALCRGDIDEMSFAYRVTDQTWSEHPDWAGDEMSLRTINRLNLHRGDVSAVNFGASDATDIDVVRSLEALSETDLRLAMAVIERRISETKPGGMPGQSTRDGTSPEALALLTIPSNPLLEAYRDPRSDPRSAGTARRTP